MANCSPAAPGDDTEDDVSSIGAFILGASNFIFFYNIYITWKRGEQVTADDPWGFANSLEWATSCPPPRHNFTSIPRIRSSIARPLPANQVDRDRHHEQEQRSIRWNRESRGSTSSSARLQPFFGASTCWRFSHDPTGTTALALAVALAFLTGFYVLFTGRRLPERPEDTPDGEIDEGVGELGFFSPHSWWPLFVGLAAAVAALGVAIGWWMFLIGALSLLLAVIGFVFEYYRGHYAH